MKAIFLKSLQLLPNLIKISMSIKLSQRFQSRRCQISMLDSLSMIRECPREHSLRIFHMSSRQIKSFRIIRLATRSLDNLSTGKGLFCKSKDFQFLIRAIKMVLINTRAVKMKSRTNSTLTRVMLKKTLPMTMWRVSQVLKTLVKASSEALIVHFKVVKDKTST